MVSGFAVASKAAYGLGKIGGSLGRPFLWYRPNSNGQVFQPGNLLGSIFVFIATNVGLQAKPSDWGKLDRFGAFDPSSCLPGDYLFGEGVAYFICELLPNSAAVHLVLCNQTFTWSKIGATEPGPSFRRGVRVPSSVLQGWPGGLVPVDKRSPTELHLPGSTEMPAAQIFLPVSVPGQIGRGDQLVTNESPPVTWTIQSAVLSPNGWQIAAIRAGA